MHTRRQYAIIFCDVKETKNPSVADSDIPWSVAS